MIVSKNNSMIMHIMSDTIYKTILNRLAYTLNVSQAVVNTLAYILNDHFILRHRRDNRSPT